MAWQHRLPDGVRHEGSSSEGFTLSVSQPVDEDGLAPLQCPADAGHRFKVTLTQSPSGQSSNCYCPYCGTRAATDEFLADQLPRLDAAMEAAAEQYAHQALNDMLSKAFGKGTGPASRSGLFDVTVSYQPGRPPPRRMLPTYDIEPTRRTMRCNRCSGAFAVYGLAIYCPTCGQLAPAQQFAELVRLQRDRLAALDGLDAQRRRDLVEAGVVTSICESTFKDGFGALETYLKDRFLQEAKNVTKPPATTIFQRLPGRQRALQAAPGRRSGGSRRTPGVGGAAAGGRHPPRADPQRRGDRRQVPHPGDRLAAASGGAPPGATRRRGPVP